MRILALYPSHWRKFQIFLEISSPKYFWHSPEEQLGVHRPFLTVVILMHIGGGAEIDTSWGQTLYWPLCCEQHAHCQWIKTCTTTWGMHIILGIWKSDTERIFLKVYLPWCSTIVLMCFLCSLPISLVLICMYNNFIRICKMNKWIWCWQKMGREEQNKKNWDVLCTCTNSAQ